MPQIDLNWDLIVTNPPKHDHKPIRRNHRPAALHVQFTTQKTETAHILVPVLNPALEGQLHITHLCKRKLRYWRSLKKLKRSAEGTGAAGSIPPMTKCFASTPIL